MFNLIIIMVYHNINIFFPKFYSSLTPQKVRCAYILERNASTCLQGFRVHGALLP